MVQISDLRIYPIKSCKGSSVPSVTFDRYGIVGDRRWMITDENGVFMTGRDFPKLVLAEPRIEKDVMTVSAPGMTLLQLQKTTEHKRPVAIWNDTTLALDGGDEAAAWFSEYLETPCRLVGMDESFRRPVDPDYSPHHDHVHFGDAYPVLLISEASLELLNSKLENPLSMNRFRPNIVVRGSDAHAEDLWKSFKIGDLSFDGVKLCSRCVFTTVDPETGEKGREPLRTLATYRHFGGQVWFGQNVIHRDKNGSIAVGDRITVQTEALKEVAS